MFYPNHTRVIFWGVDEAFLEWTVLERRGDSVLLNLTFFVEGNARVWYTVSVPDGKVDILDIAVVAKVFGKQVYEWGYDYNADVIEDQKVDIMDIATVAKAYGTTQGDPKYNPKVDIAPEEEREIFGHVVHHKNLLLDVDVYSRETFWDGEPLGKTCFWAEPYHDINDTVVLYGSPPEEFKGTVTRFQDMGTWGFPGDLLDDVTGYIVWAIQKDPCYNMDPRFDWDTGIALTVCLQGSEPANPDSHYSISFPNGTTWNITRFASTPLGTELNVDTRVIAYELKILSTNVQLGSP